jgi:hypothetical protein
MFSNHRNIGASPIGFYVEQFRYNEPAACRKQERFVAYDLLGSGRLKIG